MHFMHAAFKLRRVTAWAMLALYALVVSGVPISLGPPPEGSAAAKKIAGKDRSTPFPCMDKACGCDTSERCFSNCCCHTPAETLAWAKARGINPAVIDSLSRRVARANPSPPTGGCCSKKSVAPEPSCCSAPADEVDEAICSDYQSLAAEPKPGLGESAVADASPEQDGSAGVTVRGVVILRDMLACNGIASWWSAVSVSLPPPKPITSEQSLPTVGTLVVGDLQARGTSSPPELPPPRDC